MELHFAFLLVAVLAFVVVLLGRLLRWRLRRIERSKLEESMRLTRRLPFTPRAFLLSPAERDFHDVLIAAIAGRFHVSFKVRLADLVNSSQADWRRGYGAWIATRHIDFVLSQPVTSRIVVAIELDDQSHAHPRRRDRDEIVDRIFAQTGLPLLRLRCASSYDVAALSATLDSILPLSRSDARRQAA